MTGKLLLLLLVNTLLILLYILFTTYLLHCYTSISYISVLYTLPLYAILELLTTVGGLLLWQQSMAAINGNGAMGQRGFSLFKEWRSFIY